MPAEQHKRKFGLSGHFKGISLSASLGILFLSFVAAVILLATVELRGYEIGDATLLHLTGLVVFLPLLAYLLLAVRGRGNALRSVVGVSGRAGTWRLLWIIVPLFLLSIGLGWVWDLALYEIFPGYLESKFRMLEETPFMDPEFPPWNIAVTILSAVVVAPLVEEMLFRGLILERMAGRWGMAGGIAVSSLLFGLMHFEPLGSTLFGVFMCLLYLEGRTLLLPILCHAINNGLALLLYIAWPEENGFFDTPEQLYSQAWLGAAALLTGAVWLFLFLYRRKHALSELLRTY